MAVEKKNILLTDITDSILYKALSFGGGNRRIPKRNHLSHAEHIRGKYDEVIRNASLQKQVAAIKLRGMYVEFSSMRNYELVTKSLENRSSGIRLLNVQMTEDGFTRATVFIPEGKEDFFRKRIEQYANEKTKKGKPKNSDLVESIEDIKLAMVESFWTDRIENIPRESAVNCEIWLRYDENKNLTWDMVEKKIYSICENLAIPIDKKRRLLFPERIVKMITANIEQLKAIISNCEYITELKRAEEATTFFSSLEKSKQDMWTKDLLSRCNFTDSNVSVCILDAGINANHSLIAPAILKNGLHTVNPEWGIEDNPRERGHGTEMAGIAIYHDLQKALENPKRLDIKHKIESVKILPKDGSNSRELYGAITQEAVSLAEIDNPETKRVICMAVTSSDSPVQDGRPTSWSAALDEIASGSSEEGDNYRLFLVSAGNVSPSLFSELGYPERNSLEPVQDPAQSWNAVSIGGYSNKTNIQDPLYKGFYALAENGSLSPYSTTSVSWKRSWPIKPEVLFEAGNIATNGVDYDSCDDLSLLTTGYRPSVNYFSTIWGTSSATAQAACFCAKLYSEYPTLWPETIRALLIHSASWTEQMHKQFCPSGNTTKKAQRMTLVRHCGYGVPDLTKAIQCFDNSVNMIVQGLLQPYKKDGNRITMNEMHIHTFPWPKEVLRDLGETEVKIKVTLSYFIEPSPGEIGWKDRYRYSSCGLRFEINKVNQSRDEFLSQINKLMNNSENDDSPVASSNDWYLGVNAHGFGSIHSDFIVANAVDLCESKYVAVFPVGGWWKERGYLGKYNKKVRYSLVVSLSTPEMGIDLYTPIINQVGTVIPIAISTEN